MLFKCEIYHFAYMSLLILSSFVGVAFTCVASILLFILILPIGRIVVLSIPFPTPLFTNLGVSWFCPSLVCVSNLIVVVCAGWWTLTMCESCWIIATYVGLCWTLCNFIGVVRSCPPLLTSLKEIILFRITIRVLTFAAVNINI